MDDSQSRQSAVAGFFTWFGGLVGSWSWLPWRRFQSKNEYIERLQSQVQKQRRQLEELEELQTVSRLLNTHLELGKTLQAIMDAVMKVSGADRSLLYLFDAKKQRLNAVIGRGEKLAYFQNIQLELRKSIFAEVVRNKEPLVVEDAANHPGINAEYVRRSGTPGFVAVPMIFAGEVIGVIAVDNKHTGRPLADISVSLLETLASHAAVAIHNTRLYTKVKHFNDRLQLEIDKATTYLQRLLRQKSEFLTIVSHQLRTPIVIIRGNLSLLVEEPNLTVVERQKFLHSAYEGVNRLERIVHKLLSATEIDGNTLSLTKKDVNLYELVHRVCRSFQPLAVDKGLKLHTEYFGPVVRVRTDSDRLYEALAHVVENALHYTLEGSVTVTVRVDAACVVVEVLDTGIGIEQQQLPLVFTKFYRSENVWGIQPNGSGLGLYIAKRLMESLGGTLTVRSPGAGKGSVFTFVLPRGSE